MRQNKLLEASGLIPSLSYVIISYKIEKQGIKMLLIKKLDNDR